MMPPARRWLSIAPDQRTSPWAISSARSRAVAWIWSFVLLAMGCSITTTGWSVIPSVRARISAERTNAWVITVTAGRPRFSDSTPSWRPHVVHDPQSATA